MTPDMAKKFAEIQKKKQLPLKPPMTFKEYYNKMFLEEAKYFIENPKFSIKYAMVMAHLQKTIREKALKEYKEKYPGAPIDEPDQIVEQFEELVNDEVAEVLSVDCDETESVMSEYDIVDDPTIYNEEKTSVRRSKRLQNKSI